MKESLTNIYGHKQERLQRRKLELELQCVPRFREMVFGHYRRI